MTLGLRQRTGVVDWSVRTRQCVRTRRSRDSRRHRLLSTRSTITVTEVILIDVLDSVRDVVRIELFVPSFHREVAPESCLVRGVWHPDSIAFFFPSLV